MKLMEKFVSQNVATNLGAVNWHADSGVAAIYEPASEEMLAWAEGKLGRELPLEMRVLLAETNGFFLKKVTLYGIPPSLFKAGVLNRGRLQPLDIITANKFWRIKYQVPLDHLMIGSIQGQSENTGIFMRQDGLVFRVDSGGTSAPFDFVDSLGDLLENA